MDERITDVCLHHTFTPTHARARVFWRTRIRADRARTFPRRRLRVARLAGVRPSICVQRKHRRVEHSGRHGLDPGMRRIRPAARTAADALGRGSMRRGHCARRHRRGA
jgi:hypothetical protein